MDLLVGGRLGAVRQGIVGADALLALHDDTGNPVAAVMRVVHEEVRLVARPVDLHWTLLAVAEDFVGVGQPVTRPDTDRPLPLVAGPQLGVQPFLNGPSPLAFG